MGKHSQYGVILDAGSSGTRIYIYQWKHPIAAGENLSPENLRKLPMVKLKKSKKIHPGIATFVNDLTVVGHDHVQPLLDAALEEIPHHKIKSTPIYLMATAGVRLLPNFQQVELLQRVCAFLKVNANFHLPNCKEQVKVIAGETEGLYGWIATNYLLGGLDRPDEHSHGKGHHTYGFLDMGGASAQIAFAPNVTEAERHANDLKLIRLRHLDGSSSEFQVFSASWLGFGVNKARSRYIQTLVESYYGDNANEIPDPCLPKGLRISAARQVSAEKHLNNADVLLGTGAFNECLRKTYPLLGMDKPCEEHPCLLDGKHVPAIDFEVNRFLGISEYWHATHGFFGKGGEAYDIATFQQKVIDFCGREWEAIQREILDRHKNPGKRIQDAQGACFKASWLMNILYEGIGIPRAGSEPIASSNANAIPGTKLDNAKHELSDPFQPIDTVRGVEVSWTLGKMVLYAAGQIRPGESKLPVGFGSNVASEVPPDFEHAGSSPLPAGSLTETHNFDEQQSRSSGSQAIYSALGLMVVIGLLVYVCRKPDRRRTIFKVVTSWGYQPGRKSRRRETLMSSLFGRRSANYERVLEEGDTAAYELDATQGWDHSHSDEGLLDRAISAELGTKKSLPRLESPPVSSVMDRAGLAIRTESRERLSTNVQMLNAGRRSRAGSPARLKSPFVVPPQDT
ncbi:hypothetical protein E4U22_008800 [Claviceps purpurea]|uniref:Related to apyrase (NDPase/NTPase) n=1 Tax=Claviceps purpurea (strain 20.1) TaxID=1111077 RepID=M1WCN4_CLAP2|nr:hypothetical protein E4U12_008270 [Claviceps purpurea]KAG6314414.1 hypothetical protein E4U22_008800 [Claviceps purpurea]CCE34315.1 related to apyrase (NDPase/NTPase) [Claviceps purpurea 20.1]